jgi:predicted ATP-dependent serine protease
VTDLAFERDPNFKKTGAEEEASFGEVRKHHSSSTAAFDAKFKLAAGHKYLEGISARALMQKTFSEIRYIIPGYVAEGLTVLAGAPKVGKSWMTLGWALSVAGERPAFGSLNTDAGDVLYLALEDNQRRLQKRLKSMAVGSVPERLTLMTEWPSIDDGCVEQIAHWIEATPQPRMVIVDVLARVRGAVSGKETAYDGDYRLITGLQQLAGQHGIAIVVVHHTRKMAADDPFDAVSGTRGLTGAADSVLVLKADTRTGQMMLYGRGRDIEEIETGVRFKSDNGTWEIIGSAHEIAGSNERQPILDLLIRSGKPLKISEIADAVGKTYDTTRKNLTRMANAGEIKKVDLGLYGCPNRPDIR